MSAPEYKTVDKFDRVIGGLKGRLDVTAVAPSPVQSEIALIGGVEAWIVQTFREKEEEHQKGGDYIALQYLDAERSLRLVLPPKVAEKIAQQREALTTKNRRRAAKERAAKDKAAGIEPGFMRKKGRKK